MVEKDLKKVIVLGYGYMGVKLAREITGTGRACITAVFDVTESGRQRAKADGYRSVKTAEEAFSEDADICVIATPNDTHKAYALDALNAGMHVIVEKPVALNTVELDEMLKASHEAGRILTAHFNRRFDADFLSINQLIKSGTLGRITDIESRIVGSRGIPSCWRRKRAFGGGMLYDWGPHLIDQMLLLADDREISDVKCEFSYRLGEEVEDGFYLTIYFADGLRTFIEVNTQNYIPLPRFYVTGDRGSAIINDWRDKCMVTQPVTEKLCGIEVDNETVSAFKGNRTMVPLDEEDTVTYEMERPKGDSSEFFKNFFDVLDGKTELVVTEEQLRKGMKVIDLAYEINSSKA